MKPKLAQHFLQGMPWRFFRKLALMQVIVTSLMIVVTAYISRQYLRTYIINQSQEQIEDSLSFLISSFSREGYDINRWCDVLTTSKRTRFTMIGLDGTPLCDTFFNIDEMDNHADRPEVIAALTHGLGFSNRHSDTSQSQIMYGAVLVKNAEGQDWFILRHGFPLERLSAALKALDQSVFIFVLPLLLLTSLFSLYGSLQVSSPLRSLLAKIEHMKRISRRTQRKHHAEGPELTDIDPESDEWDLLEKTLDKAKEDLENYLSELYVENEKINILMESISDCILAINTNEMILLANGQFRKNFVPLDYKKRDLADFKIWEIIRDADVQDLYREVMNTENPKKVRNILLDIKGGKARGYFDLTISPMHDSENKLFGAVCVFHNVTDRKTAEQLREDFVTNVSHEVRTPLTALKGYVQVLKSALQKDQLNDDILNCLARIESNSDRLTHLFNDILNLSVIESKRKVDKLPLNTEEITSSVIANVRQGYLKKKIELSTDYQTPTVYANPVLLEQVLTNLLDNAYKYTPEGGKVRIVWTTDNLHYVLKVIDSGEQIPKEHHPRLFERFYRVDPSRSREQGGTGLGLAIVKHIVQKHYGSISVGHNPEGGNYFCVLFPIKERFKSE